MDFQHFLCISTNVVPSTNLVFAPVVNCGIFAYLYMLHVYTLCRSFVRWLRQNESKESLLEFLKRKALALLFSEMGEMDICRVTRTMGQLS